VSPSVTPTTLPVKVSWALIGGAASRNSRSRSDGRICGVAFRVLIPSEMGTDVGVHDQPHVGSTTFVTVSNRRPILPRSSWSLGNP
jgi:hypothetical protein